MPFWLEQLRRLKIAPKLVLTLRNPLDVAASLESRDRFSTKISLLLWLRYLLDAEAATRGLPRSWVHYEDLMSDWRTATGDLGSKLALNWPNRTREVEREIDEFLTRKLRHHKSSLEQLLIRTDVLEWVKSVYKLLSDRTLSIEDHPAARETLDQVRLQFDSACDAFRPLIAAELRLALADLERVSRELEFHTSEHKKLLRRGKGISTT